MKIKTILKQCTPKILFGRKYPAPLNFFTKQINRLTNRDYLILVNSAYSEELTITPPELGLVAKAIKEQLEYQLVKINKVLLEKNFTKGYNKKRCEIEILYPFIRVRRSDDVTKVHYIVHFYTIIQVYKKGQLIFNYRII